MLTQALLFVELYVPASMVGIALYVALMLTKGAVREVCQGLCVLLIIYPSFFIFVSIPVALVLSLLCIAPALVEQKLDNKFGPGYYYIRLFGATYLSTIIGCIAFIFSSTKIGIAPADFNINVVAFLLGFVFAPLSIPFIRWMFESSKLRPGFDRHLQEGEADPQEENNHATNGNS